MDIGPPTFTLALCALSLAWLAVASPCRAQEPVTVGELLSYGSSYNQHLVIVEGRAGNVRAYPEARYDQAVVYGSYAFSLEDHTGAIEVEVFGSIQPGVVTPIEPGTSVRVRGIFNKIARGDELYQYIKASGLEMLESESEK
ncbi:MAG: OB-fold nucleic acid binding domain-containing protein [Nitrospirales bacterium]